MNKLKSLTISAVVIMLALGLVLSGTADAGIRDILKKDKPLPTIELKGIELKGTAVSGVFKPIAFIENTINHQNYWYNVGDNLSGGRIVEIRRGAIVLEINGKRYLYGMPEGAIKGMVKGEPSEEGAEAIEFGENVADNVWNVKLDTAIGMLTKVSRIMKDARMRPYFALGKAAGIRLDRIKSGSVIRSMGIEDGDVIKGINGFGLMSPTRLFEAYRKYKNEQLIQVQLLRNDRPTTLTYNIVR